MSPLPQEQQASELVPIADRMRYLQAMRCAAVAAVLVFSIVSPDLDLGPLAVAAISGAYLAFAFAAQAGWNVTRALGVYLFGVTLMLDAVYLVGFSFASGWLESPLSYLVVVHLVVVALLASYRTGMKLALWDSLVLVVLHELQKDGLLSPPEGAAAVSFDRVAISTAVFMVVAAATATFSAVNERELRRRRYDLEALARMARRLEESEGSVAAAEVLVGSVADAYDFERALLLASGEADGDALSLLAFHGEVNAGAAFAPTGQASAVRLARERREVELVSHLDPAEDPWLDALLPDARKVAVFPLTVETRSIGVLCVEHSMRSGSRIERRVVSTIERFASHGALALHNAWLHERIREMAHTDGLTGVGNRATFEARLSTEIARAARHEENVSLLMVDVDRFKLLNDKHGHLIGDDVLRRVARQLEEGCREFDSVARYGGEEFAVVLPATNAEDALLVADRMRRLVDDPAEIPRVTVSIGSATFPLDGAQPAELVTAADRALYRSKGAGRNRVTASSMPENLPARA